MARSVTALVMALAEIVLFAAASHGQTAHGELDWVDTVYSDGRHNAFTDLVRWKDEYYLCFRHGDSHGSMDGEIRIMRSPDMRKWETCATLSTWGDDRDPHFTAAGDTLYIYFGTWDLTHQEGHGLPGRHRIRCYVSSTADGKTWSKIQGIYVPGWWVWRVRYLEGQFYGLAYTAYRPRPAERELELLASEDGLNWSVASHIAEQRQPSESDVTMLEDGSLLVVTRMQDQVNEGFTWRSNPGRTRWTGQTTGDIIHAPALARWHDRFFVAGRSKQDGHWVTRIWELVGDRAVELITLPSGGDTSYPGLIVDPATVEAESPALFVTWYSQHEVDKEKNPNAASIYAARVVVRNK